MEMNHLSRRDCLLSAGGLGLGLFAASKFSFAIEHEEADEVTANEDLMREHGVIRRALLIYRESARRARDDPHSLPLSVLGDTAKLFREFGEDYHEHALEEEHIFPVVRKVKGPIAKLPDTLLTQHRRGREITDYISQVSAKPRLTPVEAVSLASALENFVRMYDPHADREDTELFPAWKAALGKKAYAEMGDQFEEIEHKTFGLDGFEYALKRIEGFEAAFGMAELAAMTAPHPQSDKK